MTLAKLWAPLNHWELYLLILLNHTLRKQLSQKTSYTAFGCAFGPNRNSSQHFATYTSSILPHLSMCSIWSRLDQAASGYIPQTILTSSLRIHITAYACLRYILVDPLYKRYTVTPIYYWMLQMLLSMKFQNLFTPIPWVLFTFPSLYLFSFGHI